MNENKNRKRAVDPNDPSQASLSLQSASVSAGFENDGQDNITSPGQCLYSTTSAEDRARINLLKPSGEPNFKQQLD
jgi:hypothetical protein